MAKKKKTRKQKVLSDLRHPHVATKSERSSTESLPEQAEPAQETNIFRYAINAAPVIAAVPQKAGSAKSEHRYIMQDLRKTAFVTTAIVTSQIVLYFLLTKFW